MPFREIKVIFRRVDPGSAAWWEMRYCLPGQEQPILTLKRGFEDGQAALQSAFSVLLASMNHILLGDQELLRVLELAQAERATNVPSAQRTVKGELEGGYHILRPEDQQPIEINDMGRQDLLVAATLVVTCPSVIEE